MYHKDQTNIVSLISYSSMSMELIPAESMKLFVEGVSPDWTLRAFYGRSSDCREFPLPAAGHKQESVQVTQHKQQRGRETQWEREYNFCPNLSLDWLQLLLSSDLLPAILSASFCVKTSKIRCHDTS